jgi:redox-sensing transcriptional repressor
MAISEKNIERLSLYRRLLDHIKRQGKANVFSHELSTLSTNSSAQVRRDLMVIGHSGSPTKGYNVEKLIDAIDTLLDGKREQRIALVGVGTLGRAVLDHFLGRRSKLRIVAAFDIADNKVNRVINECKVYPVEELESRIQESSITLGILAVPASSAQDTADKMVMAGIRGILNFVPVPLRVPINVYVEDIDLIMAMEKVAFFTRKLSFASEFIASQTAATITQEGSE